MKIDKEELLRRAIIIKDNYEGIVPLNEVFYLSSLLYSAELSLIAFESYEPNMEKKNATFLISSLQEALGHAAALSRYFWPSLNTKKKNKSALELVREQRGIKLCREFGVDEDSPLKDRRIRNAWEHFDERLDEYLIQLDAGFVFPESQLGNCDLADDPVGHVFKLLDMENSCLVLLNEKYYFAPIKEEVSSIYKKAKGMYDGSGRLG